MVQLDLDLVRAGVLDGALEDDAVALDLDAAEFALEAVRDVLGGDGAESLAGLAGLECEGDLELVDAAGQFFGLVQLPGLALGALGLERVELLQGRWASPRRLCRAE